ncbi:MAG TPA: hypothetical protein VLW54_10760 [Candidatus Acidoferrales bacterium]|nr:hypothetical protein [Candidatus Acidoferrales bacterium]
MTQLDCYIVRTDCVECVQTVGEHPNVRQLTALPRDWILYEFHHEIFRDPDYLVEGTWEEKMTRSPRLRALRIEMLNQERRLIAPYYKDLKVPSDARGVLGTSVCEYRICAKGRLRFPTFEHGSGWDNLAAFTLSLEAAPNRAAAALPELISEWIECSQGSLTSMHHLQAIEGGFTLQGVCSGNSGHWFAALWALLADVRWKTGVSNMRLRRDEGD